MRPPSTFFSLADPLCEEDNEHEEEFYYNEIEIPLNLSAPPARSSSLASSASANGGGGASSAKKKRLTGESAAAATAAHSLLAAAALPVLADHMDMARPPHENPEYYRDASAVVFSQFLLRRRRSNDARSALKDYLSPTRSQSKTSIVEINECLGNNSRLERNLAQIAHAGASPSSAAATAAADGAQRATAATPRGLSRVDIGGGDAATVVAAPKELLRGDDAHRHSGVQHCFLCLLRDGGDGNDVTNGE